VHGVAATIFAARLAQKLKTVLESFALQDCFIWMARKFVPRKKRVRSALQITLQLPFCGAVAERRAMLTNDVRLRADHAELRYGLNISPDAAIWAIRLLLGREPENDDEVRLLCTCQDVAALRDAVENLSVPADVDPQAPDKLLSADRQHWRNMADSLHGRTGSPTSLDQAAWAIRLFLDREPQSFEEIRYHRQHKDGAALRHAFLDSPEFINRRLWRQKKDFRLPLFMLQPPEDSRIPWQFSPPTMAAPVTQVATEGQFHEPDYKRLAALYHVTPNLHRKQWEFMYIHRVLEQAGMLQPGRRLLGFGTGKEPLPSAFTACGAEVMATDAPAEDDNLQGWSSTNQYSTSVEDLFMPHLVSREVFDKRIDFQPADMNAIPHNLRGFDACWSACAFEHLGSIEHGLRFFQNSLETLKPGGIAVHTTELNYSSNDETLESRGLSLFRRQDFERLLSRLLDEGHEVAPLNLHPGTGPADHHVDTPPWSLPHLRLDAGKYVTTSIGIVARRRL
jgi:hypothetical protein